MSGGKVVLVVIVNNSYIYRKNTTEDLLFRIWNEEIKNAIDKYHEYTEGSQYISEIRVMGAEYIEEVD